MQTQQIFSLQDINKKSENKNSDKMAISFDLPHSFNVYPAIDSIPYMSLHANAVSVSRSPKTVPLNAAQAAKARRLFPIKTFRL